MVGRALTTLRLASGGARLVPLSWLGAFGERAAAVIGPRISEAKAAQLRRHIARVDPDRTDGELRAAARRGFGSYGRYWVDTFRLPHLATVNVDRLFSYHGFHKIVEVRATGIGPIIVLPHLGSWEWAAAWLGRVMDVPVTAVVERLEPEEVFQWFGQLRSSYGVNVVPIGPRAMIGLTAAVRQRHVVCLLADRDVGGTGVEVDFFGETTALPVGPALLARRTGAPLLPTAVFYRGRQRIAIVGDPIWPEHGGRDRGQNQRLTQAVTDSLATLIARAPEQWHLLAPNWPSDRVNDL